MLVLNTNKNEQVDWISNYNLRGGAYPDASQALIHFAWSNGSNICVYPGPETYTTAITCYCEWINNVVTPVNKTVRALEMNWTPINYIDHPIRPSNSLYWAYASASVWCYNRIYPQAYPTSAWFAADRTWCQNVWEIHKTTRFWTVWTLDAWITVWKNFRLQLYYWNYPGVYAWVNVATFNSLEAGIKLKWWLMHRDWTIDYAWETCRCYCGKPTATWAYYICWAPSTTTWNNAIFYWESNWIVSQEWDRPIVDLDNYMCWDMNYVTTWQAAMMNTSGSAQCWSRWDFGFWRRWQWSNDNDEYSRPFQISLDV